MVLISFSEPKHIKKILNGEKRQTTRPPRKYPIEICSMAQLYYKPRMKKSCKNCIADCGYSICGMTEYIPAMLCSNHINFFGTAKIIKVEELDFNLLSPGELEAWAIADGFESWDQANDWFVKHNGPDWTSSIWNVITWKPAWINEVII